MNYKTMIKKSAAVFFAAVLCTLPLSLSAQIPSTEEMYGILEKQYSAGNFDKDITCTLSLIIEKPNEPKSAQQYKLFRRDTKDQTTLVQLAPEADKGTGYMQEKNNLWVYDPTSHQFTHSSLKRAIGDSDASVSDVNKRSEFRKTYEITDIAASKLGKFDVYAVTLKTLLSDARYAQEKYYVRKTDPLILKIESYGSSGRLMRTTLLPKYVKIGNFNWPAQSIYINEINKGEKTTQILSDFDTSDIPDVVFTKAYLEKIN
ncbi:outer membrane lipoprotein-sorting protein [Treponema vincentii]|uniref:outer membrane lipoprotein-sorting protein n=1 Tax=Treponema vincentii TaxID=69710 RepID=UPI0020A3E53A|nr:outer membrane lipoprotein-sorting protein [Treponema vincentii]UTC47235.1 outer membrane lipoprotein-sorting protein [Treponema vincentii]